MTKPNFVLQSSRARHLYEYASKREVFELLIDAVRTRLDGQVNEYPPQIIRVLWFDLYDTGRTGDKPADFNEYDDLYRVASKSILAAMLYTLTEENAQAAEFADWLDLIEISWTYLQNTGRIQRPNPLAHVDDMTRLMPLGVG